MRLSVSPVKLHVLASYNRMDTISDGSMLPYRLKFAKYICCFSNSVVNLWSKISIICDWAAKVDKFPHLIRRATRSGPALVLSFCQSIYLSVTSRLVNYLV